MTNLFKKSLLATALLAIAGTASAANILEADAAPTAVSKQNAAGSFTTTGNNVSVTLANDIAAGASMVGTEVVVTYSGAQLSTAPTLASGAGETWTRTAVSATSATFRLDATDGVTAATDKLVISGHQWLTSSLLDSDGVSITVAVRSATGVGIEPAGTGEKLTRKIVYVGDEYGVKVSTAAGSKMDRVIDLSTSRTKFTSATGGEATANTRYSRLTFNVTDAVGATYKNDAGTDTVANFATTTTRGDTDFTLTGDFSWIKDDNATTAGIQAKAGTFLFSDATNCSVKTITAGSVQFTCTNAFTAGDGYIRFDIYQGGTASPVAVNDADFTLSAVQKFTPASGSATSVAAANNVAAGSWTNNGTTKALDYMPFGTDISQIIYVTNLTAEVGKIYVTATLEDGSKLLSGVYLADTIANGITPLAAKLEAALEGQAVAGKKVALSFDIESSNATLYGAYKVGSDRALVVTR